MFKRAFKTGFLNKNLILNLCSDAVKLNSQILLFSQKAGVKSHWRWHIGPFKLNSFCQIHLWTDFDENLYECVYPYFCLILIYFRRRWIEGIASKVTLFYTYVQLKDLLLCQIKLLYILPVSSFPYRQSIWLQKKIYVSLSAQIYCLIQLKFKRGLKNIILYKHNTLRLLQFLSDF